MNKLRFNEMVVGMAIAGVVDIKVDDDKMVVHFVVNTEHCAGYIAEFSEYAMPTGINILKDDVALWYYINIGEEDDKTA